MVLHDILHFFGLTRSRPLTPSCKLPGCSRPCFIESNGHVYDYCGVTHARQAQAPSSPAPAATRFDGTKEYLFPGVLLFWQPPSVFSQWTPSIFVVENVSLPHAGFLFAFADMFFSCIVYPRAHATVRVCSIRGEGHRLCWARPGFLGLLTSAVFLTQVFLKLSPFWKTAAVVSTSLSLLEDCCCCSLHVSTPARSIKYLLFPSKNTAPYHASSGGVQLRGTVHDGRKGQAFRRRR